MDKSQVHVNKLHRIRSFSLGYLLFSRSLENSISISFLTLELAAKLLQVSHIVAIDGNQISFLSDELLPVVTKGGVLLDGLALGNNAILILVDYLKQFFGVYKAGLLRNIRISKFLSLVMDL